MIKVDHLVRSQKLTQIICEEIACATDQNISFARFMELALLAPSLGYYQATENLFGHEGDFVTAPEISPLFARCLARYCEPILKTLSSNISIIMEVGAGTGRLAADLLLALEALDCLPSEYIIVEVSEDLQQQQRKNLHCWIPHLVERITYTKSFSDLPIEGIILANEVIDALPVHRFSLYEGVMYEQQVAWNGTQFVWQRGEPRGGELRERLYKIQTDYLQAVDSYDSEVRLSLDNWFISLQAQLKRGYIILIDYGMSAQEYYHPQRHKGTLRCYYQHQCVTDPLQRVGLQDITSHVDFSQVAELAVQSGLQINGFISQAAFLLASGLLASDELCYHDMDYLKIKGQIHQLIAPVEMGESCKVMVLGRELPCNLLSLEEYDRRISL